MRWPWSKRPKVEPSIPTGAIRKRLRYVGKVQAVGFRFTVDGCAKETGVTGWVRNMDDGSVVCEVQGTPDQVSRFMRSVQEQIDNPKTWIEGRLDTAEAIEAVPDTHFSIHNL
ncbi:MAG: acylphosphatase [Atopobiaceae bacterium]|nr:acylphosphatase [Atopobiaceae bacterium]